MATVQDIVDFLDAWRSKNSIDDGVDLSEVQKVQLAKDLQGEISKLSFQVEGNGTTIPAYAA